MNDSNYRKEAQEYFQKAIEESKSLSPKEALLLLLERLFSWGDFEYDNIYGAEKELHEPILTEIDKCLVEIKKNKQLVSEITNELTKRIKKDKDAHETTPMIWFYPNGELNLFYLDVIEKIDGLKIALPILIEELKWIKAECVPYGEDEILVGVGGDESLLKVGERIIEVIAQLKQSKPFSFVVERLASICVRRSSSRFFAFFKRFLSLHLDIGITEKLVLCFFRITEYNSFFYCF